MAQTTSNVTAAKPATGGSLWVAATTVSLPASTSASLSSFTGLGYISEDGLTNEITRDSEEIKAWGGDTVLRPQTGFTDTFSCTLIETLNKDVLKEIFGASNVTGALSTGVAVEVNSDELAERAWVFDMVMRGDVAKRVVIPNGRITEVGEISYRDDEASGYEITITAFPDSSGNTHYEYIKEPAS